MQKGECLDYSTYGVCGHTLAVSSRSCYKKMAITLTCLNFQTLEFRVVQEQRKASKECDPKKYISDDQRIKEN